MEVLITTFVPVAPEKAFDLSLDIGVHLDSMAHSNESAIAGVKEGLIALGESVTWKAKHFGVTWKMTSKITELERPNFFVDEQVKGPFAKFHHVHRFEAVEGGTTMTDQITYRAPFSLLGHTVDRLILNRYLTNLIVVRNEFIVATAKKRGTNNE